MEIAPSVFEDEARRHVEEEALEALVDQYASTLYRVAFSILRNPSDAEDAVQEAFLRVLRHRESLGEIRDHRVWLIRIVWNIVLDRKRRAKDAPRNRRRRRAGPRSARRWTERRTARRRSAASCARAGLRRAAADERARGDGCSPRSRSSPAWRLLRVLGITESSVRSRLFRARNLMADLLHHERSLR